MTGAPATAMIAGAEVLVGGSPLPPKVADKLVEVRVEDNLMLPDAFLIRIADPGLEAVDDGLLQIGAEVVIRLAGSEAKTLTAVLEGQIATLEPEFGAGAAILAARGYDHSHVLHRTPRTQTYQNMTAGDIARKVAQRGGLSAGTIEAGGGVHDFVQQSEETDWSFLWRLAAAMDFEVVVADRKLHFRRAGGPREAAVPLRWGKTLLAFRPRVTGLQQAEKVVVRGWDPTRNAAIEGSAGRPDTDSTNGVPKAEIVAALGGGTVTVGDRAVTSQQEADALAKSVAAHLANAAVEAEGTCQGDARLKAGSRIQVEGVGTRFGGTYTLSATTHVYRGKQGYRTHFTISGRAPRTLLDLMTPAPARAWAGSLAVGVVTQNDDPKKLGRVRVKYPSLGDDTEGWWARVVAPGAAENRGLMMLPVPGDEVVVGFEHGDVRRPYVLGSLWNGVELPGKLADPDGSLSLRSAHRVTVAAKEDLAVKSEEGAMTVAAKGKLGISSDADLTVEAKGKVTEKASGEFAVEGRQVAIKAQGGSVTIEGATQIEVKAGAAGVKLGSAGTVQISGTKISLG
jgi:phage protein D